MKYVYDIVPIYIKYERFLNREEIIENVNFWIERFDETPIDLSFKEFISICKIKYNKNNSNC